MDDGRPIGMKNGPQREDVSWGGEGGQIVEAYY